MKDESKLNPQQIKDCNAKISYLHKEIESLTNSLCEKEAAVAQLQGELQTHQQVAIPPKQLLKLTMEIVKLEHKLQKAKEQKQQTELERRGVVHEMKAWREVQHLGKL